MNVRIRLLSNAILLAAGLIGAAANAAALQVNPAAVGNPSLGFIKQLDNQMTPFMRGLSTQAPSEFNALQMALMLNQSANIEQKLDVLIAEIKETNRLLKQKK